MSQFAALLTRHCLPVFVGKRRHGATTGVLINFTLGLCLLAGNDGVSSIRSERQSSGESSPHCSLLLSFKGKAMRGEHWKISRQCLPLNGWSSCPGMQVGLLCWQQRAQCQGRWNTSVGHYTERRGSRGKWSVTNPTLAFTVVTLVKKDRWVVDCV